MTHPQEGMTDHHLAAKVRELTGKETNVEAAAELEEVARVAEEGTRGAAEAEEIVDAGHVGDEPQPSADPNDKPVEEEDKPKRRRR